MSSRRTLRPEHERERLAQEAARVIVESGVRDFGLAKRKAMERLRAAPGVLPANDEIERAIEAYQRLFHAETHPRLLLELRCIALRVMERLEQFRPKLVGAVLAGTADEHSAITVHLFADAAEDVEFYLLDRRIQFEAGEQRLRVRRDDWLRLPTFTLLVDDVPVALVAFGGKSRHEAPLSPVDARPMRRAALAAVRALVQERL